MINLKQLETIYWLRELENYQLVADRLNLTQPAISARITSLEQTIGSNLIDREAAHFQFTPMGIEVTEYAERMLMLHDTMMADIKTDPRTKIRLGIVGPVFMTWLPELLERLKANMPRLIVEITTGSNVQLSRHIRAGAIDLAFVSRLPGDEPPFRSFAVDYRLGWVGCPDPELMDGRTLTLADIGRQPLVLYPSSAPLYSPVQNILPELETKQSGPRHFANSLSTIVDMVRRGYGLSAIPVAVVEDAIDSGALVIYPVDHHLASLRIYCSHISNDRRQLMTSVLAEAREAAVTYARRLPEFVSIVKG